MERAAAGDVTAFGVLFDRHQARLVAFLTRFLGERSLAEDIAQEAFWNVWRKRETFNPRQSFLVYLYVAAKNLAINERASARHRRTVSLEALPESGASRNLPDASNDPLDQALRSDLQCAVRRALQELPEDQRLSLLLHEYDACSYGEIARIMGCSVVSARVLSFRGRRRLKRLLAPLLAAEADEENQDSVDGALL